jgi:isoquinoline 1-oxidoreductase beta subunit
MIHLTLNDKPKALDVDPSMPLLWALRDVLGLKGTKYGCGVGLCGVCTILIDGQANHACMVPLGKAAGHRVTTVEGLAEQRHPLLAAWVAEQVPQCGYCQPGQIMAAAALLARHRHPSEVATAAAMSAVLCRCGTYPRIRRAISRAAAGSREESLVTRRVHVDDPDCEFIALDDWIRIAPDGRVILTINHSEMGQGSLTGLAMLLAEELEVDLEQVQTTFAPAAARYRNPMFNEQTTGGSTSIRGEWERLRTAAARARVRLLRAAADIWQVKSDECEVARGVVVHPPTGRRLGYGALIGKAVSYAAPRKVALKEPGSFRLLGTSQPRLEVPAMVTGSAVYGADVALPGMLVASVLRCPVFGGSAKSVDASAARKVSGVRQIIEIQRGIAVLAENAWAALSAREHLNVSWDLGTKAELDNARLSRRLTDAAAKQGKVAQNRGNPEQVLRHATRIIEAHYQTSYLAHATLEPMNCVAQVTNHGCDVWVGTQSQEGAQETAARICGLPKDKVRVHSTLLGGGFGRRLESDFVAEAVELAKRSGTPVQVLWTRADDFQHDFYRPAHHTAVKAVLDDEGMPVAWWQRAVGPALALDMIDVPYDIPNYREEHVLVEPPVPVGAWRSVGAGQNAFAVESFADELAHVANQDALTYRLALLATAPRHRAVLELAAEKSGWHTSAAARSARGIALYRSFGTYVAQVAEISVGDDKRPRVERVVCAIDCGQVINRDAVCAQLEGSIAMGLSAALTEQVCIDKGRVTQVTFEDYPILTFAEMPAVEVHIIASAEKPGGVGEPGVPPVAPAVANAVFAATGTRPRSLPLQATLGRAHQSFA